MKKKGRNDTFWPTLINALAAISCPAKVPSQTVRRNIPPLLCWELLSKTNETKEAQEITLTNSPH
jgi:hypothetical protein